MQQYTVDWLVSLQAKIIPKPLNLMHPLMQDRNDADVAIREMSPVDEMVLVAKEEPEREGEVPAFQTDDFQDVNLGTSNFIEKNCNTSM